MANLSSMKARGQGKTSMRNDVAMVEKSQRPQNKDPEDVTPGPEWQKPTKSSAIKMKLPESMAKGTSDGEEAHHLASGHHVKNADGSTSFHMHALDGEPVSADNMEPSEEEGGADGATSGSGTGMEMQGDPYGVATALRGMSA